MTPEEIAAQAAADAAKATADAQKAADEKAAADKANAEKNAEKLFSQADLDRIVTDRLADEKRRAEKRIADKAAEAEQERLKAQGEYKILAEQHERRAKELEEQIAAEKLESLRLKVGAEKRLRPWEQSKLSGSTYEEMIADAEKAVADRTPPTAPNINPGSPANGGKPTVEAARDRLLKSGDYHRV